MKYWVNTVSRDHVQLGVEGGFTQAGHGKASGLNRLAAGDWLVFYSTKTRLPDGERLQAFTAIGRVADDELYQVEMAPGFVPWRRNVKFLRCEETPIAPLIDELTSSRTSDVGATSSASAYSRSGGKTSSASSTRCPQQPKT
jgi:EVE domain